MAGYVQRRLYLAEATGDSDVITQSLITMGVYYHGTQAPITSRALIEAAAEIARANDRTTTLALALNNLASILLSRDLPAALEAAREGLAMARRVGVAGMVDYTAVNLASALWQSGRLDEMATHLDEVQPTTSIPMLRLAMLSFRCRLADARGEPLPDVPGGRAGDTESDIGVLSDLGIWAARAAGDTEAAATLASECLPHLLNAGGIDDDFSVLWPPLVEAALASDDVGLAEVMLHPVESAAAGVVSLGVRAQWRRLRGLLGALRGDEAAQVESDLRAGVDLQGEFGAIGLQARAREDLARWLVSQDRAAEARPLVASALATYDQMGAHGWLARLDDWAAALLPVAR